MHMPAPALYFGQVESTSAVSTKDEAVWTCHIYHSNCY